MKKKIIIIVITFIGAVLVVAASVIVPKLIEKYRLEKAFEEALSQFPIEEETKMATEYGDDFTVEYFWTGLLAARWTVIIDIDDVRSVFNFEVDVNKIGIVGILDNDYVRCYKIGDEIIFRRKAEKKF
jgi:NADH:ubiquinone oxidoreductase subunit 3 (subunit A)